MKKHWKPVKNLAENIENQGKPRKNQETTKKKYTKVSGLFIF
jgi:hypothetical protein